MLDGVAPFLPGTTPWQLNTPDVTTNKQRKILKGRRRRLATQDTTVGSLDFLIASHKSWMGM